jgi:serine O-acetyltransferase
MFKGMREDVRAVFDRDPAARHWFEVVTTSPGLHAIWMHRLSHRLWSVGLKWLARVTAQFGRFLTGIEIHPGAQIGRRFFIDHGMGVVIGETAEIGDDCTLYHGVTLGGTTWNPGKRHPTLHAGVVVGAGAKILGPIEVGAGARVGSNAVVTRAVPEGATAMGIPARCVQHGQTDAEFEVDTRRRQMHEKAGFDLYALGDDMPDPVAKSIHAILDQLHRVDSKLQVMGEHLCEVNSKYCDEALPSLDEHQLMDATDGGQQTPPEQG